MSDLFEYYSQNRREIEIFANQTSLFALSFITHTSPISRVRLAEALGASYDTVDRVIEILADAGFVAIESNTRLICSTKNAEDALNALGFAKASSAASRPAASDANKFEVFLEALGSDVVSRGLRYQDLRRNLTMYFRRAGITETEPLVDRAIDRLIVKSPTISGWPLPFALGIAKMVLMEERKTAMKEATETLVNRGSELQVLDQCIGRCLANLKRGDRDLISKYYRRRTPEKSIQELESSAGALRFQIFSITKTLKACVNNCMKTGPVGTSA